MHNSNDNEIMKKLNEYKSIVEKDGHEVLYVGLKGSQNYNLATESSDIDAVAIVKPVKYSQRKISYTISTKKDSNEDEIQVQDILTFTFSLISGNCRCIEVINSRYSIGKLPPAFYEVKENVQSQYFMMIQKYEKLEHPYPSKIELIEKYGYDPKQYHHIVRLHKILKQQVENGSYDIYYEDSAERDKLLAIKTNPTQSLNEVKSVIEQLMNEAKSFNKIIEANVSSKAIKQYNYDLDLEKKVIKYLNQLDRDDYNEEIKKKIKNNLTCDSKTKKRLLESF